MSAGNHRQSGQPYRLPLHAAVISAVDGADVRCAPRRSPGLPPFIGAVPAWLARPDSSSGAEAEGVWTR